MKKRGVLLTMAAAFVLVVIFKSGSSAVEKKDVISAASAENGTIHSKDEVVYASLTANGTAEDVYVVNILDVVHPGIVKDFGDYTNLKNLSTTEPIVKTDEGIKVESEVGKFYYQGDLNKAQLPWIFEISYLLDGQPADVASLTGKTGKLEIKIKTKQNPDADKSFYQYYLLQISLLLNMDKCSEIVTEGGTLANAGNKKQVTFTGMPGKDGDFSVSTNVEDFELSGIDIAAVPFSMDIELPDTTELTSGLSQLSTAMQQLDEGVLGLKDGIGMLNGAAAQLKNGSVEYLNGMNALAGQSQNLVSASSSIYNALEKISISLENEMGNLDMGELAMLPAGLSQAAEGLAGIGGGLDLLKTNYDAAYSALDQAIASIPGDAISQDDIQRLYMENPDNPAVNSLVNAYTTAMTVKGTYAQIQPAFLAVSGALEDSEAGIMEISGMLNTLSAQLTENLEKLDIQASLSGLFSGLMELKSQYGLFHNGLVEYTEGVNRLSGAYSELNGGFSQLASGMGDVAAGAYTLSEGTGTLRERTQGLPDQVAEEIEAMTAEYDMSDFKPVSFVSADNTNVNSVQFVIKAGGVKLEKEKTEEQNTEKEPEGFWEKFQDLFTQ